MYYLCNTSYKDSPFFRSGAERAPKDPQSDVLGDGWL